MILFNDVRSTYLEQQQEIDSAMSAVIESAAFINGPAVKEFEQNFARYSATQFCIGVSSGTSALQVAMQAAGIGVGDEVITSGMTFIASGEAISHTGAKPVLTDIDPLTLNISVETIRPALSPKTKAVLFVHLHGNSEGIIEVEKFCKQNNLLLFEDCAQAHGAIIADGRKVGSVGIASAFSFFPAKNLGAFGDAGAVCTNDKQLADKIRSLINHGRLEKYLHLTEGMNARIDTIQAAILDVKLKNLEQQIVSRNKLASYYRSELKNLPLEFQEFPSGGRHAWHLFTIMTHRRDELQKHLTLAGIQTGIHYPIPLNKQPAYEYLNLSLPNAERTAITTLSLPFYPQLPQPDAEQVVREIQSFFQS